MKKYTFKLDNTKKINNESTNNYSKIIDDIISANVIKNNPYFDSIPSTTKSKTINIDIHLGKKSPKYDKKSFDYGDIFNALKTIYNLKNEKPMYDFKLYDGTPVKMFSDEIQIGYDLIPLTGFTREYYNSLSESTRKHIIDITIDIQRAA